MLEYRSRAGPFAGASSAEPSSIAVTSTQPLMFVHPRPRSLRVDDFRVRLSDRPGWVWGTSRLPRAGDQIFCAAGIGTVKEVHGKTGDGSRLLQIVVDDAPKHPFFAAASNVLLPPVNAAGEVTIPPPADDAAPAEDDSTTWLGESEAGTYIR